MKGKSILWKTCKSQKRIFIRQKEKIWQVEIQIQKNKNKKVPEMVNMEVNV